MYHEYVVEKKSMNFLFVEDESELLNLYQIILDDIGIVYDLACDGEEALKLIAKKRYKYVFSDIRMPNMDGFELLKRIKQEKLPVESFIFITAHVDVTREEVEEKGAVDILYKPLSHAMLRSYIEELLQAA